jgi:hypothetical protein
MLDVGVGGISMLRVWISDRHAKLMLTGDAPGDLISISPVRLNMASAMRMVARTVDASRRLEVHGVMPGEYHLCNWGPQSDAVVSKLFDERSADAVRKHCVLLTVEKGGVLQRHVQRIREGAL